MNTDRQPQQPPTRDDYGQIAPESARPATLTPEQPVKAPGQGGDLLLTRETPVEAEWPNGAHSLYYVDEGGCQYAAKQVGNGRPLPWGDGRIVRSGGGFSRSDTRPRPASLSCVLTEDKPTQEPVLPRRIKPEDVRVGMVVERRKGEAAHRDRVHRIDGDLIVGTDGAWLWVPGNADGGWTLWLVEDAPAPEDPDAADRQCAWADYRKDYGVGESEMMAAHKAFMAGWKAAREGDQSGLLR